MLGWTKWEAAEVVRSHQVWDVRICCCFVCKNEKESSMVDCALQKYLES
jgi:hypothetical protein